MSTEYTPDTEDVAFCYEGPDMDAGERRAGFERWLASVKAEAWEVGVNEHPASGMPRLPNPYRADEMKKGAGT